jgi:hypothetical protein
MIGMASQPALDSVVNAMNTVKPKTSMKIIFLTMLENLTSSLVNVRQIKPKQVSQALNKIG